MLQISYRCIFSGLRVSILFSRTKNLRIRHLISVSRIMLTVCLRLSMAGNSLSIASPDWASQSRGANLKRLMRRIKMSFVVIVLFFWSAQFFIWDRLSRVSLVRRRVLGHGDIFVAIGCQVVFMAPRCVRFVKITFFIYVFVRIWTLGLTIPEL